MQALSQLSYGPLGLPRGLGGAGQNPEHSSGLISSLLLLVIADDVGEVLVAFFLVGHDGGIVIIVIFVISGDLDTTFQFANYALPLPPNLPAPVSAPRH